MLQRIHPDIRLSNGRTVKHYRAANGSQDAIPTPGPNALTPEEHEEYMQLLRSPTLASIKTDLVYAINQLERIVPCDAVQQALDALERVAEGVDLMAAHEVQLAEWTTEQILAREG
jgi:hypothetical protein